MSNPSLLEILRQAQQQNQLPGVGSTSTIPAARTKDPGGVPFQALESGSQSRFFGTEDIGQPPPVKPFPLSAGQRQAMRGAQTEVQRGLREINMGGPEAQDIYQEELAREDKSGWVQPAFDLLTIGNVTTAGLVDGFIKGDYNLADGLAQAATEFGNALPFVDWTKGGPFGKKAYAPGYADVLRNAEIFNSSAAGRYTSAALGFVFDVALDPTTYTGYGIGNAVARASRAGGTVKALTELERFAGNRSRFMGERVGRLGEMFLPEYRNKQWALNSPEAAEGIQRFLANKRKTNAELLRENIDLKDKAAVLFAGMSPNEQHLIGTLIDQPDKLKTSVQQYLAGRGMDPTGDEYYRVAGVIDGLREYYLERSDDLVKSGLLEPSEVRAHFVVGANPLTVLSGRASDDIIKKLGVQTRPVSKGYQPYASPVLARNESFMKAKEFQTLEERLLAGFPTETRASAQMIGYGMNVNRSLATRRLLNSVIDDPSIVRQINSLDAGDLLMNRQFIRDSEREGYVIFDLKNVRGLTFDDLQRASMGEAKTTTFMIPKPIAEDLMRANNTFKDTSEFGRIVDHYREVLGLWKGYALFSTGYHMRNLFSNAYLNYIGGVSNVKDYAEALALQAGGTSSLPTGVRGSVVKLIGERKMEDVWRTLPDGTKLTGHDLLREASNGGVTNSGVMARDLPMDAERELVTKFEMDNRKSIAVESPLSPYAERFKKSLESTGRYTANPEYADFMARFYDLQARKWSMDAGRPSSVWWKQMNVKVQASEVGGVDPKSLFQSGGLRKWEGDEPAVMHGEVEDAISSIFSRNSNPTEANFLAAAKSNPAIADLMSYGRKRTGGVFSYDALKRQAIDALQAGEINGNAHLWYRDFTDEVAENVGRHNAPEASALFGVLSVDKAADQAMAQTYTAMTIARQLKSAGRPITADTFRSAAKGTVLDGASVQQMQGIASLYTDGITPGQELVSAFGQRLSGGNAARYENYLDHRLAKDLGVNVEDIRSSAWWYRRNATKLPYVSVDPAGGWRAAFDSGVQKADAPYKSSDALEALKQEMEATGFGADTNFIRGAIGRDTGHSAVMMSPVVKGIDGSASGPASMTLDMGGLFASRGLSPEENLEAQKEIWKRITTPSKSMSGERDGYEIAALKELGDKLNFTHSASFRMKATPDGPIPDFSLRIDAEDEGTVQQVAGLMADALGAEQVYWHSPRPFSATELRSAHAAGSMADLGIKEGLRFASANGKKFTAEQMDEIGKALQLRDGQEVLFDPGDDAFSILNLGDELAPDELGGIMEKVNGLSFASNLDRQSYLFTGGKYEASGLREAVAGLGFDVSTGGAVASDLQKRIYDRLYRPVAEVYDGFAERAISAGDDAAADVAGRIGDQSTPVLDEAFQGTLFQKVNGAASRGAMQFEKDGQALIHLFETADATTIIHEMAHVYRRSAIAAGDLKELKKAFGLKVGDTWPRYAEEKFANELTRYMLTQKAPDEAIRPVFDKIQAWMQDAWQLSRQSLPDATFNPESKGLLDRMFGASLSPDASKAMDPLAAAALSVDTKEGAGSALRKYLGTQSPQLRASRAIGVAMENNARLAHFLSKISKTGDLSVSAASTRKYLIDYDELTPFEREVMRSIIPFYSWMRKNIPLQFQAMLENPGRYAKVPKAIRAVEEMSEEWQQVQTPDYFDDLHAVRLPLVLNGGPTWINPNLPFQDLNNLNWKDILAGVSPFFKVYGEWFPAKGYSYFMDAPIEKYEGQVSSSMPWLRKKTMAQIQTLAPPVGKVMRIAEKASEGELIPALTTEIAGVKLLNPSQQQVARSNTYMQREVVRRTKDRARALGIKIPDIVEQPKARLRLRRHRSKGNQSES